MRSIAFLIVIAQVLLLGPLYLKYGQVDPCRALARQKAMQAEAKGGIGVVVDKLLGDLEVDARRDVAEHSTLQCASEIIDNWTSGATTPDK